jgi:cytochrome c oxidase subunit 4
MSHSHSGPHIVSFRLLFTIFAVLMVLTVLTVAATKIDLGYQANLGLALAIAVIKAALVMMYFMHLRWDAPFNTLIAIAALLFIAIFIVATITDTDQYRKNLSSYTNKTPIGSGTLSPR